MTKQKTLFSFFSRKKNIFEESNDNQHHRRNKDEPTKKAITTPVITTSGQEKPTPKVEKECGQLGNSSVKTALHDDQNDSSSQLSDVNMPLTRTISNSRSHSSTTVEETAPSISAKDRSHIGSNEATVLPPKSEKIQAKSKNANNGNTITLAKRNTTPKKKNGNKNRSDHDNYDDGNDTNSNIPRKCNVEESQIDTSNHYELSEYEKLRLRNMKRNHDRLVALGLIDPAMESLQQQESSACQAQSKRRKKSNKAKIACTNAASVPLRRSARNRNGTDVIIGEESIENQTSNNNPQQQQQYEKEVNDKNRMEEVDQFQDSPIVQYSMKIDRNNGTKMHLKSSPACQQQQEQHCKGKLKSFMPRSKYPKLLSPKVNHAVYSLDIYTAYMGSESIEDYNQSNIPMEWIVGAGKGGLVSIWNCSNSDVPTDTNEDRELDHNIDNYHDQDGLEPVMSWKSHGGRWVADAIFIPSKTNDLNSSYSNNTNDNNNGERPSHLLTAANDGKVCLWDVRSLSTRTGAPKNVATTGSSLHKGGIFSMHTNSKGNNYSDLLVCTGSKDKTLAVSTLDSIASSGIGDGRVTRPIFVSKHHSAKVGCVQMKGNGSTLIGSASDDGSVAVHDYRSQNIVADVDYAHDKPHSVVWDPYHSFTFLTAGYDPTIHSWDLRQLKKPLKSYHGHVPISVKNCKRIHRPCYFRPNGGCTVTEIENKYILSGGERSGCLSIFQESFLSGDENHTQSSQNKHIPVYSRGCLPEDCEDTGCIVVFGNDMAVTVNGGDILILESKYS